MIPIRRMSARLGSSPSGSLTLGAARAEAVPMTWWLGCIPTWALTLFAWSKHLKLSYLLGLSLNACL